MSGSDYRAVAERALGRKLKTHEHVHHHSETQFVICDRRYHQWLHGVMRERGIKSPRLQWRESVALPRKMTFRVTAAEAQQLKRLATNHDRKIADMIRQIFRQGLKAIRRAK